LTNLGNALRAGQSDIAALEKAAQDELSAAGLVPEYVEVRSFDGLGPAHAATSKVAVLAAARLGKVRLIDNIVVDINE
jgi:pantoate--beta-alanine ligase